MLKKLYVLKYIYILEINMTIILLIKSNKKIRDASAINKGKRRRFPFPFSITKNCIFHFHCD